MVTIPRVVIAAPGSGHGKTSVTTGLLAALRARGLTVSPHKVGPDYIDPGYHALAAGRPGRNLDPWLVGEERIAPMFAHGAGTPRPADVAVIEGVMGLFDGVARGGGGGGGEAGWERADWERAGQEGFASTAHVARLLGAPVILVVDARGMAASAAALLHGFATWDPGTRIGGVIFNQVGSARHEELLREAADAAGVPVLGVLHRQDRLTVPSRHLGLIPAAELGRPALDAVAALAATVAAGVDLEAVVRLARTAGAVPETAGALPKAAGPLPKAAGPLPKAAGPLPKAAGPLPKAAGLLPGVDVTQGQGSENPDQREERTRHPLSRIGGSPPPIPPGPPPRIAIAAGPAFTFGYAEHPELLAAAGAEVVTFDPLHDERLPDGVDGLVIGGGFPEEHAGRLSANARLRSEVAALAEAGAPVIAECAGLLYLTRSLDGHPMCGVLDASATMSGTLTLGYRDAVAAAASPLAAAGARVHGHEFHRSTVQRSSVQPSAPGGEAGVDTAAWHWRRGGAPVSEGFVRGRVHASYLHTHWAGLPGAADRLAAATLVYQASRVNHPS